MNVLNSLRLVLFSPAVFLQQVVGELRQVTWPSRKETIKATLIVIVFSIVVGAYIAVLDFGFAEGLKLIVNLRQ